MKLLVTILICTILCVVAGQAAWVASRYYVRARRILKRQTYNPTKKDLELAAAILHGWSNTYELDPKHPVRIASCQVWEYLNYLKTLKK